MAIGMSSCESIPLTTISIYPDDRALRHIRLLNTPERKPITNSRDTQELHYEAGVEVLQIFLDHQTKSKTSLLQDFAYYEVCFLLSARGPLFFLPS